MPHTDPDFPAGCLACSAPTYAAHAPAASATPAACTTPAAAAISAADDDPTDLLARLLARARQERRLLSVHWELTHRCNERCRHCFLPVTAPGDPRDAARAHQELSTGEALALIDQLAALGVLYVTFSGGEPLLRDDFFVLAEHVRRRHLALRVYTNGTLLTGRHLDQHPGQPAAAPVDSMAADPAADPAARLAALHPLAVEISVYGADGATHDAITGMPGSWEATLAALRRLQALGVPTVCKTPLMAANAFQVTALAVLAAQVGARFQPDPLLTAGVAGTARQRRAPLALRMSDAELAAVLRPLAVQWAPAPGRGGPLLCTIGRSALALDPYGTVFPCVEVRRPLGSIRRTPLAAIWHDTAAWRPYLRLSATDGATDPASALAALPTCRACRLAAYCVRCHGAAANETGDLYGPSPQHCRAARVRRALVHELAQAGDQTKR